MQTKPPSPPKKKTKASAKIPQKLPYHKTDEEVKESAKKDLDDFWASFEKKKEARKNPQKEVVLTRAQLRQKASEYQQSLREARKASPLSDYDRSLQKTYEKELKKKSTGRGIPQLGQHSQQQIEPLVINDQYGSNVHIPLEQLNDFLADAGLDANQCLLNAPIETAVVVDTWKKYEYGKPLWNPTEYSKLGTQMFLLNKWYIEACARDELFLPVRVRQEHYFRGDDVIFINFEDLHLLFHQDSLDKAIVSCYCL